MCYRESVSESNTNTNTNTNTNSGIDVDLLKELEDVSYTPSDTNNKTMTFDQEDDKHYSLSQPIIPDDIN